MFDVNRKRRVARGGADSLDDAKRIAESIAAAYFPYQNAGDLPVIEWKLNPQSHTAVSTGN